MLAMSSAGGIDRDPGPATCDLCRHPHACYVGGAVLAASGPATSWALHVCLGCLMRAADPDAFGSCAGCATPANAGGRHA